MTDAMMGDVQAAAELCSIALWPLVGAWGYSLLSGWPRRVRRAAAS